jgi:hypothetical protein
LLQFPVKGEKMSRLFESRSAFLTGRSRLHHLPPLLEESGDWADRFFGIVLEGFSDRLAGVRGILRRASSSDETFSGESTDMQKEYEEIRNKAYLDIYRNIR